FDRQFRKTAQRANVPLDDSNRYAFAQQILQQHINEELLQQTAHDMGLVVGPETVAQNLKSILKSYTKKGVSEKEALNQLLHQQDLSETEPASLISSDLTSNVIMQAVLVGTYAPHQ